MTSPPASLIGNGWLVTCHSCGGYDLAGPGHPAVRPNGDGTFELYDRDAIRITHPDGCPATLDFRFIGMP